MRDDNTMSVLREALRKSPTVEPGTVLRFSMDLSRYTYTALWIDGKWWFSGVWQGQRRFTNDEFLTKVLPLVENLEVATRWEKV